MIDFKQFRDNIADTYKQYHGEEYANAFSSGYQKKFDEVKKEKENKRVLGFWNGWSTTKTWKAFWVLPFASDDAAVGAFFGGQFSNPKEIFKSESLKDAERKATAEGAVEAYKLAVSNGLEGEKLASFAEKVKESETYAAQSKERHGATFGALFSVAFAIAMMATLGPLGAALGLAAIIIGPFAGFAYDRHKDKQAKESGIETGKQAAAAAKSGEILPCAEKERAEYIQKAKEKSVATPQAIEMPTKNHAADITTRREADKGLQKS